MVIRKKKKSRKRRGSRTHGWGAGKKHRGAGHRGGKGRAGAGKRGAQKKTAHLAKGINPIGKKGKQISRREKKVKPNPINLKELDQKLDFWLAENKAVKEGDVFVVDLTKLGYTAVLGGGNISKKVKLICNKVSSRAKEKIEAAGGSVLAPERNG